VAEQLRQDAGLGSLSFSFEGVHLQRQGGLRNKGVKHDPLLRIQRRSRLGGIQSENGVGFLSVGSHGKMEERRRLKGVRSVAGLSTVVKHPLSHGGFLIIGRNGAGDSAGISNAPTGLGKIEYHLRAKGTCDFLHGGVQNRFGPASGCQTVSQTREDGCLSLAIAGQRCPHAKVVGECADQQPHEEQAAKGREVAWGLHEQ
jgi:hypothetical protein